MVICGQQIPDRLGDGRDSHRILRLGLVYNQFSVDTVPPVLSLRWLVLFLHPSLSLRAPATRPAKAQRLVPGRKLHQETSLLLLHGMGSNFSPFWAVCRHLSVYQTQMFLSRLF